MRRLILLCLLGVGVSQAVELKESPFGTLKLEGAITVYGIHTNNKVGLE